jgi:hypothetical protein
VSSAVATLTLVIQSVVLFSGMVNFQWNFTEIDKRLNKMGFMNFGKKIGKNLSGSLSSKIASQKSFHKKNNSHMYNGILLRISYDNNGPYISATLWSDYYNPNRISEGKEICFFKCPVDSPIDGMNQITIEVSKAKNLHPELYYFKSTSLLKEDLQEYLSMLQGEETLCSSRIEEIINNGHINSWKNKKKFTQINEIYSNGSWSITDEKPWIEHEVGFDLD